jgi:hypothetical protein
MAAYSSRISRVTTHPVTYPEPNDSNSMRFLLFVRIECADGAVGWGEAITQFAASTRAAQEIVDGLAEDLIGMISNARLGGIPIVEGPLISPCPRSILRSGISRAR